MLDEGIRPDVVFFSTLICNLCNIGWVMEAQSLIDLMEHVGVRPSAFSVTQLIYGYCCNIPDFKKQLKLDHEASSSINIK
jgi:leucine-rich PPR motif-containing protein